MPAKTKFWTCGKCGFENGPDAFRTTPEANAKCEQCGEDRAHPDAFDREGSAR